MAEWIELFKVGVHHDDVYTEADLDEMVVNFKGSKEVPLVIGHEEDQEKLLAHTGVPKFGTLDKVKREGDTIFGKFKGVARKLQNWIKSGAYNQRSIEIEFGENGKRLRRIALLGAAIPEVSDMPPIEALNDSPERISLITIKNEAKPMPNTDVKKNQDEEIVDDAVVPDEATMEQRLANIEAQIAQIMAALAELGSEDVVSEVEDEEEDMTTSKTDKVDPKVAELEVAIATLKAKDLARDSQELATQNESFVAKMCSEGRLFPASADKALIGLNESQGKARVSFMEALAAAPQNQMFAEISKSGGKVVSADDKIAKEVDADLADPEYMKFSSGRTREELIAIRKSE